MAHSHLHTLHHIRPRAIHFFFFFNDAAPPEIYPLSLHDALPISRGARRMARPLQQDLRRRPRHRHVRRHLLRRRLRSEEHTSELQSLTNLVCRLLLEKKKKSQRPARPKRRTPLSAARQPRRPCEY